MKKEYFKMMIKVNNIYVDFAIELITKKKLSLEELANACEEIAKCCMYSQEWEFVKGMSYREYRLGTRKISYIYCIAEF